MPGELRVEYMTQEGAREIGILDAPQVDIGREPEKGIAVPRESVSRTHGLFTRYRNVWVYRDGGSTNGSWINGTPVKEGMLTIVRSGDTLQLADAVLRFSPAERRTDLSDTYAGLAPPGVRSILIFSRGQFHDEFPVPQFGRAIAIGGARGDLPIDAHAGELPSLVIEGRGENVVALSLLNGTTFTVNEVPFEQGKTATVRDRDTIEIGHYKILINDPTEKPVRAGAVPVDDSPLSGILQERAWGAGSTSPSGRAALGSDTARISSTRSAPKLPFGQGNFADDDEGTVTIDSGKLATLATTRGADPSYQRARQDDGEKGSIEKLEERAILLIGVVLLVAIIVLLVWWLFG